MRVFKFLVLGALWILVMNSCEKELVRPNDKPIEEVRIEQHSDDPFFDLNYTHDKLDLGVTREGYYRFIDQSIDQFESGVESNNIFNVFKEQNIYPCWSCAEPEYFGFYNYYVPFYNLRSEALHGVMIIQEKNNQRMKYYLAASMVRHIARERDEPFSKYWNKIMDYFDGGVEGKDKTEYFESRVLGCFNSAATNWCVCEGTGEPCFADPSSSVTDCLPFCSGDGSGDDDDDGGDDDDDGGPHDVADWTLPGDTKHGGGGGPVIPDPTPSWDSFCGGFNGSLPTGTANADGEFVLDEEEGIIGIMDPADLYDMQLQGFIDTYGLPYSSEELFDIIGEDCAVSNVSDVVDCIKCHFISPLGLSDASNWGLMDDFGTVADCINEPTPNCVACNLSVEQFEIKYGLDLTESEAQEILGLIDTETCATPEFDYLAGRILLESRLGVSIQNVVITEGVIIGKAFNGLIHILAGDPPDINQMSNQEILDHVMFVLNCANLYFCETGEYEPIDWRNYFSNMTQQSYVFSPTSGGAFYNNCPMGLLFDLSWGGFVMDTYPGGPNGQTSDDPPLNFWKWNSINSSDIPILQLSLTGSCASDFYDFVNPDCE